jgi:hypothetical protein
MRDYWTCSKFADWLRGTMKPGAATSKGWNEWKKEAQTKHPVRFWIAEEGLDKLQDIWCWIPDRINDVRYYINNRWVHQTHGMVSHSLKKGQWHEFETRLLHSVFDQLVDFIEIEQAWHHAMWSEDTCKKYQTPWWQKHWLFRWGKQWRCPDAGVEYLIWASGLTLGDSWGVDKTSEDYGKPTGQAQTAKELLELYRWWKYERPKRPDPMDASGWSDYCEQRRAKGHDFLDFQDKTPEEAEVSRIALDKSQEIENAYNKEDEEMLIRVIKIRQGLWT